MIVVVGIDGVLARSAWRSDASVDWDEYNLLSKQDEPCIEMIELVNQLWLSEKSHKIIALTSRPRKWRTITTDWIIRHDIHIDELLMRPDDSYLSSPELKVSLVKDLMPIGLVIDDRDDVCQAFRALGVTTMQVTHA